MAYKQLKLWFDGELAQKLATDIQVYHPSFNATAFTDAVESGVDNLELKDRVELIADQLDQCLIGSYSDAADLIIKVLGPENEEATGMFTNYYWVMPLAKYIEKYGLEDLPTSFKAIEEITKRNTGEYAIRPYLKQHQDETLVQMKKWSKSQNFHVRRLASEGVRPRLPWATKLQSFIDNPTPILPILDSLKDDPKNYVQKSVANCLNDILKDNLEVGRETVEQWLLESHVPKQRKWVVKHGLRGLLKKEDNWAKSIVGSL